VEGKVVLITGGARGVGAATATRLVAHGARVVLVDLDADPLSELAERLGEERATSIAADVTDLGEMEQAVAHAVGRFGGIDVVANAGIASYGSVAAVDPAVFRRLIDINITGVFHTVRAALVELERRRGYVLVVSSAAAYAPAPGLAAYNASKAGVEHFANALRLELGYRGIAVGSAHMSWIDTPMVQDAKRDLTAFREMLDALPGALGATTSVEQCAEAFVRGIDKRAARVNVPGWVGLLRLLKPALTSRLAELQGRRDARRIVPLMDEEVARLGRSASDRVTVP
jgi:NAD(P)-dependent dehydrogenase (short-subunit alcohol dehydrogenase family)